MNKLGLSKKLLLSYAAMIVPMTLLGYLALTSGKFAETSLEKIYVGQVLPAKELEDIKEHSRDMLSRMTGYLAGQIPAAGARNKLAENQRSIEESWVRFTKAIQGRDLDDEQKKLITGLEQSIQGDVKKFVANCSAALTAESKDNALDILDNDWPKIQLGLLKPIDKLKAASDLSIKNFYDQSRERSTRVQRWLFAAILSTILTLAVSMSMVYRITRSLTDSMSHIDSLGNHVRTESSECSSSTRNLSSGITGVAASLEETASAIEELTSLVKTNSQHTNDAARISSASTQTAESGKGKIDEMITTINGMAESSRKIESACASIDDLVFQINLLSLNASVEAARAGEAGKGFAVVADAVRTLAHKSAGSAKQINALIKDNVEKAQTGKAIAGESSMALDEIVNSIRHVSDLNCQIASASEQQLQGLMQISTAVSQIDSISQANASISENLVISTDQMADQGKSLQELVGKLLGVIKGGKSEAA